MASISTLRSDHRHPFRLVVVVLAMVSILSLVSLVLLDLASAGRVGGAVAFGFGVYSLTAVGTLIILRRPRNRIGGLCVAAGVLGSVALLSGRYVEYGLASRPGSVPAVMAVGWFSLWLGSAWVWILLFVPLVFPDGHLPSRRWRPAARLSAALMAVDCAIRALRPTVPDWEPLPYNPLGIVGAEPLFAILERVLAFDIAVPLVLAVTALIVRFRRSAGIERLQLKWLTYALVQLAALFTVYLAVPRAFPQPFSDLVFGFSFSLLPVAIAVAVLRYRLYDIDRIINRTIVYAAVTVALGVIYAGSVLIAGSLFSGGGRRSEWIVAASTLIAFGAFRPIRTRTQEAVDQRFNRTRYDAQRTIAAFTASLRAQLDVDALSGELLRVTRSAVQPDRCSLWLRTNLR